jgi:hypothetical protein
MRTAIAILIVALALIGTATAAVNAKRYYVNFGEIAVTNGGEVQCLGILKNDFIRPGPGSSGFRCFVGGDYRAKYGVIISSQSVKVLQYVSRDRYRVIITKQQAAAP